jgi:cysteinyl-tRNA synthetase
MILEEDSESIQTRRKKAFGTTIVYRPPDQSHFTSNVPKSSTRSNHSEESSNDEDLDSEVVKIKEMTTTLQSSVRNELKNHKKAYQQYIEANKSLNSLVKNYTVEIEDVKSTAYSALAQSFQTCAEIKKIRESISGKDSRGPSRNQNEENPLEVLMNMKKEIQVMQERLYANEMVIEEKAKENNDLKSFIGKVQDHKTSVETQERKVGCSQCLIY